MTAWAVTVVGDDRPGITAAVTGALARAGANLEDTSCTVLRGHFAMTLIVGEGVDRSAVAGALAPVAQELALGVSVHAVSSPPERPGRGGEPHRVTLHGADRPGIVSAVSALLADVRGNVTDLTTRLSGDLYVLSVDVDLPTGTDVAGLRDRLGATAEGLGVRARLEPVDVDVL